MLVEGRIKVQAVEFETVMKVASVAVYGTAAELYSGIFVTVRCASSVASTRDGAGLAARVLAVLFAGTSTSG